MYFSKKVFHDVHCWYSFIVHIIGLLNWLAIKAGVFAYYLLENFQKRLINVTTDFVRILLSIFWYYLYKFVEWNFLFFIFFRVELIRNLIQGKKLFKMAFFSFFLTRILALGGTLCRLNYIFNTTVKTCQYIYSKILLENHLSVCKTFNTQFW